MAASAIRRPGSNFTYPDLEIPPVLRLSARSAARLERFEEMLHLALFARDIKAHSTSAGQHGEAEHHGGDMFPIGRFLRMIEQKVRQLSGRVGVVLEADGGREVALKLGQVGRRNRREGDTDVRED